MRGLQQTRRFHPDGLTAVQLLKATGGSASTGNQERKLYTNTRTRIC